MMAEKHVTGSELGELQLAIWKDQFGAAPRRRPVLLPQRPAAELHPPELRHRLPQDAGSDHRPQHRHPVVGVAGQRVPPAGRSGRRGDGIGRRRQRGRRAGRRRGRRFDGVVPDPARRQRRQQGPAQRQAGVGARRTGRPLPGPFRRRTQAPATPPGPVESRLILPRSRGVPSALRRDAAPIEPASTSCAAVRRAPPGDRSRSGSTDAAGRAGWACSGRGRGLSGGPRPPVRDC